MSDIKKDFQELSIETYPWFSQKLLKGKSVILNSLEDLPKKAKLEKEQLETAASIIEQTAKEFHFLKEDFVR